MTSPSNHSLCEMIRMVTRVGIILAGTLAEVDGCNWWYKKVAKQEEISIDKYYSSVKIIHAEVQYIL